VDALLTARLKNLIVEESAPFLFDAALKRSKQGAGTVLKGHNFVGRGEIRESTTNLWPDLDD